jgi:hypothetical protein
MIRLFQRLWLRTTIHLEEKGIQRELYMKPKNSDAGTSPLINNGDENRAKLTTRQTRRRICRCSVREWSRLPAANTERSLFY